MIPNQQQVEFVCSLGDQHVFFHGDNMNENQGGQSRQCSDKTQEGTVVALFLRA